ncbi:YjgB family protein [Brevibacillus migulae]|uniref:YjgB family protein n=1 Tax=Brevibacillus migulae TaxID=1644114 RepID=UPI00106E8FB5|nr:YjgB family protein [Brevibacillus migulae]
MKKITFISCSLLALGALYFIGIEKAGQLFKPTAAASATLPRGSSPIGTSADKAHTQGVAPAAQQSLLSSVMKSAQSGRILEGPFQLEKTMFEDVTAKWGEPEQTFSANGISYASYLKGHHTIIGYNKGMQVVDIQLFDPRFSSIQETEVIQTLGQPASTQDLSGLITYTYPVDDGDRLLVSMEQPANAPAKVVTSIRLLSPVGMRNIMAIGSNLELAEGTRYLATQGKVLGSDSPVGQTVFETVEKEWGPPYASKTSQGITYASYPLQGIVIGYNKGMQIVEERSYDLRLRELTRSEIKKVYGEPKETRTFGDQIIDVYPLSDRYEVKMVYARPTSQKPDPHVDHMNVLYPKGFVNLMLQ